MSVCVHATEVDAALALDGVAWHARLAVHLDVERERRHEQHVEGVADAQDREQPPHRQRLVRHGPTHRHVPGCHTGSGTKVNYSPGLNVSLFVLRPEFQMSGSKVSWFPCLYQNLC